MRGNVDLLGEARHWWNVVGGSIVPPPLEGEGEFLTQALAALPEEPWDTGTWEAWIRALRERSGRRGKALFHPLRLTLTAEESGPELRDLLVLMGRERVAGRLRMAAS